MLPFEFLGYVWAMMFYGGMTALLYAAILFIPKWK